jgi:hypothetical protein
MRIKSKLLFDNYVEAFNINSVPDFLKTLKLRIFGLFKVPLISYCRPTVIELSDQKSIVKLPLDYRTKNHLRSMYFGAQSVGADTCIGLLALHHIESRNQKLSLVFKDFQISFLKRALDDVHFICTEGHKVKELVELVIQSQSRQSANIKGFAIVPSIDPNEIVAEFSLTLSLK